VPLIVVPAIIGLFVAIKRHYTHLDASLHVEPEDLRPAIAKRAAQLLRELRLTRVKLPG